MITDPTVSEILSRAAAEGRKSLSEHESKLLLASYGVPVAEEQLAATPAEAAAAAARIGFPVALKACGAAITHKTEKKLVELNLADAAAVEAAAAALAGRAGAQLEGFLVQRMARGAREFAAGLVRDPTFGPCVMFGLGGIHAEALGDVAFRVAPLRRGDARAMIAEIKSAPILGPFRGMKPVDAGQLCGILTAVGRIGLEIEAVKEIDINPIIISDDGAPTAVDALVTLA